MYSHEIWLLSILFHSNIIEAKLIFKIFFSLKDKCTPLTQEDKHSQIETSPKTKKNSYFHLKCTESNGENLRKIALTCMKSMCRISNKVWVLTCIINVNVTLTLVFHLSTE